MNPSTTALILCGGGATRLGGIDKPLREFCSEPLLARVLQCIAPQSGAILISANRNLDRYAAFAPVVTDADEFANGGPLAGVLAGLGSAVSEDVLCVPGDAPLLPPNLLEKLTDARKRTPDAALAYAHDGRGPQPLCCLLSRTLLDDLEQYLRRGGRTPREWFQQHRAAVADFSGWPAWAWSINTPEEWLNSEARFITREFA